MNEAKQLLLAMIKLEYSFPCFLRKKMKETDPRYLKLQKAYKLELNKNK